ncbi:protein of unknown function LppY and LpqO [Gemmatirosa kalamazoonensis]|uniref:Peptidase M23 n=1 Tax=Gemmatirosa kalamazoonensis TaxID=861299 RepID=W0RGV4_9BACT|nr:DUF1259 domain-containing protein [Gemmatirosa kalamazoonensis]AHG89657.1 protein of unknown function LppY and LpqO [Gemmatirosa kalamazoonensis]
MQCRFSLVSLICVAAAAHAQPARDWAAVDSALGRKGAAQAAGVMRYGFPRSDLQVTVNGVRLAPALALGSWLAFRDVGGGSVMAMGDLVMLEAEVGPVMRALQAGGVEQTALHNHVLGESPHVMYMHVSAHGDPVKIARTVHDALARTGTPAASPAPATPPALDLDTAAVARTLGVAGKANGGVYQVSVPRRETIREDGHEVPPSMGVATAINFQPTGSGRAAITGDFVLRAAEVNPVIRALHGAGIEVTALHSHMLDEEPRLFFMHFWANDDAAALARGLRNALDHMAVRTAGR